MKKLILAAAAVTLTACADATAPTQLRSPGSASNDMSQNETVPSAFVAYNPCNGDAVALTGTLHIQVNYTTSASLNQHYTIDLTGQYSGVGVPSLVNYNGNTRNFDSFSSQNPLPIEETMISTYSVTSATGEDNFSVTVQYKVTINSLGVPTAETQFIRSACTG